MKPLILSGLRFHLRRPAQLLLSLAGVALGVAVVAAMHLAIDSARRGFDLSNEAVFGRVTHVLEAGPSGIDERLYLLLRLRHRDIVSAPMVQGRVRLDGTDRDLTLLGVDPFAEAPFRPQSPSPGGGDLSRLLTEPGTVAASAGTARSLGVAAGGRIQVVAAGRRQDVTLAAVLPAGNELEEAGLQGVLVADIATAQELLGRVGRLSRIDLRLPPLDTPQGAAALATLEQLLPPGVRLEQGTARANVRREMTRAFYLNLRMLSLLTLVVGLFLIYNAMTFSVVRRRSLIGTLRAVGVSAREVLLMVVAEAAVMGAAATALGLPLGIWLGARLLELVTRTVDDLYFSTAVRAFSVTGLDLAVPVALGVVGSIVAAIAPALEATRIPPRAAMTPSHLERRARRTAPMLAGAAVCASVLALVLLAGNQRSLGAAFGALFLLVAVATALTPAATVGMSKLLERVARVPGGSIGVMAARGLRAGLGRTSVAVAALMVALATTVGVTVMVASFRASLSDWLQATLAADVYVGVPGRGATAILPEDLAATVAALPGVAAVSETRDVDVSTGYGTVWLKAVSVDGPRYRGLAVLDVDADTAWRALADSGAVLVSEPFAWRHGLTRGSLLPLYTDHGPRSLPVAGIFRDYGSDRGMLLMGLPDYRSQFSDDAVSGIGVRLADGANAETVVAHITAAAGTGHALQVRSQRWIREASLAIFERTFAITRVLEWLASLVACVGVLSALMALALERAREMAVLRAQGMTRRELLSLTVLQTGGMGLIAGLLSLPLGVLMALVLVHVINRRAFGWGMDFHLPPDAMAHAMLVAIVAALLAGLYPAWRMANTSAAQALRES